MGREDGLRKGVAHVPGHLPALISASEGLVRTKAFGMTYLEANHLVHYSNDLSREQFTLHVVAGFEGLAFFETSAVHFGVHNLST